MATTQRTETFTVDDVEYATRAERRPDGSWHVQVYQDGEPVGQPLGVDATTREDLAVVRGEDAVPLLMQSARAAIERGDHRGIPLVPRYYLQSSLEGSELLDRIEEAVAGMEPVGPGREYITQRSRPDAFQQVDMLTVGLRAGAGELVVVLVSEGPDGPVRVDPKPVEDMSFDPRLSTSEIARKVRDLLGPVQSAFRERFGTALSLELKDYAH